jgi:hypothetical protein
MRALLQCARRQRCGGSALPPRLTDSHPTVAARLHCWVTLTAVTVCDALKIYRVNSRAKMFQLKTTRNSSPNPF